MQVTKSNIIPYQKQQYGLCAYRVVRSYCYLNAEQTATHQVFYQFMQ